MTALARPMARGIRGAVATGHPLATASALTAFGAGGGAVDAAVAAAYSLCVLLPESCGLGGDALFTVRDGYEGMASFNGSGKAPRNFSGEVPSDGPRTATVPGLVRALEDAHQRFGRLPRAQLTSDAARLARGGFPAGESLVSAVGRQLTRLQRSASHWEPLGQPLDPGRLVRQPALAELLDEIGRHGPSAFYEGEIAEAIVTVANREDAALDADDLREHATAIAEPLRAAFRDANVHGQPPVSQAVLGLMALRRLDELDTAQGPERVHAAVEAIEAAFAHRDRVAERDAGMLLLNETLQIDLQRALRRGGPTVQTHTTAVATADAAGTVVSMVISVFDEFGCATLVPKGGFFLNNRMMGFSANRESPNAAGPGKRPVHTLSPMLVETPDGAFGIATPGADGQVQTLTQVVDGILCEGLSPTAALDRRRWRSSESRLVLEQGFDPQTAAWLESAGHDVTWGPAGDRPFGAAVIAGIDLHHSSLFAAADLRREAWAAAC